MQQNMTETQKQFIRLNPTVGYEYDEALENEVDLAIDFCLICEAPLVRDAAGKEVDDLPLADPTWLDAFNAEAEQSFEASFDLDALHEELRRRKKGAA